MSQLTQKFWKCVLPPLASQKKNWDVGTFLCTNEFLETNIYILTTVREW